MIYVRAHWCARAVSITSQFGEFNFDFHVDMRGRTGDFPEHAAGVEAIATEEAGACRCCALMFVRDIRWRDVEFRWGKSRITSAF